MPLLWLSLAFMAGIPLAAALKLPVRFWLLMAGLSGLTLMVHWLARRRDSSPTDQPPFIHLPLPLLLAAAFLGGARWQAIQPDLSDPHFIASYSGGESEYIIEGLLVEPPDRRDRYTNLRVQVARLRPLEELTFTGVDGLMLARVSNNANYRYGDRLRLEGLLEIPPQDESFSYREYLARQGIYAYMPNARADVLLHNQGNPFYAAIYAFKGQAMAAVYRLYPDPEASLLAGILLGAENGIPQDVARAFEITGTSHIIAISGFNITIIAGLFASLFGRVLGRWRGALAALVAIAIYTLLVGAESAVVRAALMGGLALFARQVGRRQQGLNSLAVVAALMALVNPNVLWDVGFQLSFAATLGLVLYAEPLTRWFQRQASRLLAPESAERLAGPVGEFFLFTLAAQLTTLPVIVYHFQRLSLTSLIANPIILPAQPAVMILGGLAVLLGMVYNPSGQAAAYLAWPFVLFTIRAVELIARIPGGSLVLGEVALPWVILFYLLLLTWTFAGDRIRARLVSLSEGGSRLVPFRAALLAAMSLLTVLVWRAAATAPDGRLHLTVLEVGSGDGLLVQTPEGRYLLIDGGPSPSALSQGLGRRLPFYHRRIDYLVIAAPGEGQVASLPEVIERYPPGNVLWAGAPQATSASRYLQRTLNQINIQPITAQEGQQLELGQGASLRVLKTSRRGAILLLEWRSFQALLPIGMDFETLAALQQDHGLQPVFALLLADSGYAPVNPPEWLARLNPHIVLLSVAPGDANGLPSPDTLQALEGYTLLRTDRHGWIDISTDGQQMWVEVERR